LDDGRTCLIHCPNRYDTLEIEEIETGKKIGQNIERDPADFFQSRLQISETGKFLISAGWFWHPFGDVQYYNLDECLIDNAKLDNTASNLPINGEVCSARFISNSKLLVSLTNEPALNDEIIETEDQLFPMQIGIINLDTLKLEKKAEITQDTGDLIPINEDQAWSLYNHPKIIDLNSGEILFEHKELNTGQQNSPIIHGLDFVPTYAYDSLNRRLAVATKKGISILTYYE